MDSHARATGLVNVHPLSAARRGATSLMSIRQSALFETPPRKNGTTGSIYGPAIGIPTGGPWEPMSSSPPRSPPEVAAQMHEAPPPFLLDVATTEAPADVPTLQKVCATWAFDWDGVTLAVFDEHSGSQVGVAAEPRRVASADPIVPTMVRADGVGWRLGVADSPQLEKHVFPLLRRRGVACTIEAFADAPTGRVVRLAIVQPGYSPLTMAGGMVNRSALLIFSDPTVHLARLRTLHARMLLDDAIGYAPVEECVVGRGFARLRPPVSVTSRHPLGITDPQTVWTEVQAFLISLGKLTSDCVDLYTQSELRATGTQLDLRSASRAWRAHVGDSL